MNFAFVFISPDTFELTPMDERDVPLYSQFTALKVNNTQLHTWVSIGGWSMNDPGPYANVFSDLAASDDLQKTFATSLINFMDEYGFDGVDIDWVGSGVDSRLAAAPRTRVPISDLSRRNILSQKSDQGDLRILKTTLLGCRI